MALGRRIRAARKYRNFTQQHMADLLSISLNAYQKYEQAERFPPCETLVLIADILAVPTDWLLGRDDYLQTLGVSVDVPL